jgi:hypothetical protein
MLRIDAPVQPHGIGAFVPKQEGDIIEFVRLGN